MLVHRSFDPAQLGYYLDLLSFGFPDWRDRLQQPLSDGEAVSAIEEITSGRGETWLVARPVDSSAQYLESIFLARDRFVQHEAIARTHFLQLTNNDWQSAPKRHLNLDAVMDLVRSRRTFEEEQDNDRRLAFSWLLAHELLALPLLNQQGEVIVRDPYLLRAWNVCLQDWHGAASWNGLHANIYLGTLSTLNTLDCVRSTLRKMRGVMLEDAETIEFPGGAYATSYYSLSKLLRGSVRRQALDLASETLRMGWDPAAFALDPGNLAVAGSIALELGNTPEAIDCYEQSVALRKRPGEQPRKLGEALCELAFAHLLAGQRDRALSASKEGVELMRRPLANGQIVIDGFLVRAMFKRAVILLRSGRIGPGLSLYKEALHLAREYKLDDQYRQWKVSALVRQVLRRVRSSLGNR